MADIKPASAVSLSSPVLTYLRRHWRGSLPLPLSFLVNMLAINAGLGLLYCAILSIGDPEGLREFLAPDLLEELPWVWLAPCSPLSGGYFIFISESPLATVIFDWLVLTTPALFILSAWQNVGVAHAIGYAIARRRHLILSGLASLAILISTLINATSFLMLAVYVPQLFYHAG